MNFVLPMFSDSLLAHSQSNILFSSEFKLFVNADLSNLLFAPINFLLLYVAFILKKSFAFIIIGKLMVSYLHINILPHNFF